MTSPAIYMDIPSVWPELKLGSAPAQGNLPTFSSSGFESAKNSFEKVSSAVDYSSDKQSYLRQIFAARASEISRSGRSSGRSSVRNRYQASTAVQQFGLPPNSDRLIADTSVTPDREEASTEATTTLLAEWEGYVTQIDSKTFEADLNGVFGEGVEGEVDEATIPLDEIREADKDLLDIGALFRLCVTYEQSARGQVRRFTELVFRRMPIYMSGDMEAAKREAERLSGINVE